MVQNQDSGVDMNMGQINDVGNHLYETPVYQTEKCVRRHMQEIIYKELV